MELIKKWDTSNFFATMTGTGAHQPASPSEPQTVSNEQEAALMPDYQQAAAKALKNAFPSADEALLTRFVETFDLGLDSIQRPEQPPTEPDEAQDVPLCFRYVGKLPDRRPTADEITAEHVRSMQEPDDECPF